MFKVKYDVRRPLSIMYGHVVYVEDATQAEAAARAEEGAGVEIEALTTTVASEAEHARHLELRRRQKVWLANVVANRPNGRRVLAQTEPDA